MLLSAVSVLVVAQSSSEIPEVLMNNPVLAADVLNPSKLPALFVDLPTLILMFYFTTFQNFNLLAL